MWKKFSLNIQNIKHETAKAVLIAMPHSSDYDGFEFWFPKKLVREGSHSYQRAVSIADDMSVTLKRVSPKTFEVLEEKTVDALTIIEAFGEYKALPKGRRTNVLQPSKIEEVVTHVPAPLTPEKVEADANLVR